jgi:hypothetical protein
VSMFARFIAAISIACFSSCSLSCFYVFLVKVLNSFFICSVSCSCFCSLIRFGSGKVGVFELLARLLILRLACSECGGSRLSWRVLVLPLCVHFLVRLLPMVAGSRHRLSQ